VARELQSSLLVERCTKRRTPKHRTREDTMNPKLTIGTFAKTLTAVLVATLLGGCVTQAADDTDDIGEAHQALSLPGSGWSGLPIPCDGTSHTITYTTGKENVLSLTLSVASPTSTTAKITASSGTVEGFVVNGGPAIDDSVMGMANEDHGQVQVSFSADLAFSTSSGELTIAVSQGNFDYTLNTFPPVDDSQSYTARAAVLCE
jgi:hypothetical protein